MFEQNSVEFDITESSAIPKINKIIIKHLYEKVEIYFEDFEACSHWFQKIQTTS